MEGGVPLPPIFKQTEKFPESQFNDWGFAKLPLHGPISELSSIYLVRFPNCIVYSWVYNTQKTVKFNFDCFHSLH